MAIISVPADDNLQSAINASRAGDILELEAGAVFLGNYVLSGVLSPPVTLRGLATLRTPNSLPALKTLGATAGWRFEDVTFAAGASSGPIVQIGDGLINTEAGLPRNIVFDHCTIAADQTAKNGIELNGIDLTLRACRILGVKLAGQESHALVAFNTPGPLLVEDCVIEAGSCGVLIGGAKPAIPNGIPSDITFRRNVVTRPLTMRGGGWAVKNLFELKNAQRVVVTGNLFEHNWPDSQSGWTIVLTVRANSPSAPWTTIRDVLFESNIVRRCAMGVNILGLDSQVPNPPIAGMDVYPSTVMDGVVLRNNLFYEVDKGAWGGAGHFAQVYGSPRNLTIEGNTALCTGNILNLGGAPLTGFVFRRNLVQKLAGTYGIFGDAKGEGNAAIAFYCPDAVVTENVLAGCAASAYVSQPTNDCPPLGFVNAGFADPAGGNFRQTIFHAGCDQDAIEAAQRPPAPPPPPPPPPPTTAETIDRVCAAAVTYAGTYGGAISPQAAAADVVEYVRTALQLALVP